MDVRAYLRRIDYTGSTEPTLATLRGVHRAHLLSVPFENIDIPVLRRPLVLEPEALYEKIVMRRRGGLCYELNGSFAHLLRSMGFRVEFLSAAVFRPNGLWGTPFDHLTLRVALDEPWLADVGFGRDSFREPLRLESSEPQERYGRTYRIVQSDTLRVLQIGETGAWTDLYRFDLQPRVMYEYEATCLKHQTLPDAPFATVPVVGLATLDGRITLVDRRLKIVAGAKVEERDLPDDAARGAALRDYFGIVP